MHRRWWLLASALTLTLTAGAAVAARLVPRAGAAGRAAPAVSEHAGPENPEVGVPYPYDLYVHCGIRYARFGGRWWHADPERPPPGSGGNLLPGAMTVDSAGRAHFASTDSQVTADFAPSADPPAPCD